jgi:hypothetical protein
MVISVKGLQRIAQAGTGNPCDKYIPEPTESDLARSKKAIGGKEPDYDYDELFENAVANVQSIGDDYVTDTWRGHPDWAYAVVNWMEDRGIEFEPDEDGDVVPSKDIIVQAMNELGFLDEEEFYSIEGYYL